MRREVVACKRRIEEMREKKKGELADQMDVASFLHLVSHLVFFLFLFFYLLRMKVINQSC